MNIVKKLFGLNTNDKPSQNTNTELTPNALLDIITGEKNSGLSQQKVSDAVRALPYDQALISIAKTPSKYSAFALQNIARRLDKQELTLDQIQSNFSDIELQLTVASYCNDDQYANTLLEQVTDENTLFSLCQKAATSFLRAKLIAKIDHPDRLKQLEKRYKASDKNSFKLIRKKLEGRKALDKEKQQKEDKLNAFITDLKSHSQRSFNKDYIFKYDSLVRKLEALSDTIDDIKRQQAKKLLSACEAIIAEAHQNNEQPSNKPATVKEDTQATDSDVTPAALQSLIDQTIKTAYSLLVAKPLVNDELKNVQECIAVISQAWRVESNSSLPLNGKDERGTFSKLNDAIGAYSRTLDNDEKSTALITQLGDSDAFPSLTDADVKTIERALRPFKEIKHARFSLADTPLGKQLTAAKNKLADIEKQEKEEQHHILGLIRKAQAAVDNGQLKRAQGIRFSIAEKVEAQRHIPAHIERHWEELVTRIENLGDWQTYAISPKLGALVQSMAALAEAPKEPELQATQIKKLQDEWKAITKGSGKQHQDLWETFKSHADLAYVVCKAHYDELDTIRAQNTEKRQTLIKQLEDYNDHYDWAKANWAQVEKLLQSARKEWRDYSPSLRSNQKEQLRFFDQQIDPIQSKLDAYYQTNKAEKERLIIGLEPLIKSDDLQHAIDIAMQFQKQWKNIGRCRRKDDDVLWKQFRTHCDAIFARRNALRDQEKEAINASIAQANSAIANIKALNDLDSQTFEDAYKQLDELKATYNAVEELPKQKQMAVNKAYRAAVDAIEERHQKIKAEQRQMVWERLFTFKLKSMNQSETERESLIADINSTDEQLGPLKKSLIKGIQSFENDLTISEKHYRLLCVRAEIKNGIETPEEDKALRMEYQVQQLQAGLGQAQDTPSNRDLTEQWLSSPSAALNQYAALCDRFQANCTP